MNKNTLVPIEQEGQRVLLTSQLAESYETTPETISNNFNRNKTRYEAGKHYFVLEGDALREFKANHQFDEQLKFSTKLYLWTERGALLHAKSLNTDRAWEVYDKLVESYFRATALLEVIPSIRKTGGYNLPMDYPSALRALADAEEKRLALAAENEAQRQVIADFEPVRQYVDQILSSQGMLTTTQIAADYDLSARALNQILHEEGLQHKVNKQWILYKQHMGLGYTQSKTVHITHSDGMPDTKMNTVWTQKGRLKIHEILTARGVSALMDRGNSVSARRSTR